MTIFTKSKDSGPTIQINEDIADYNILCQHRASSECGYDEMQVYSKTMKWGPIRGKAKLKKLFSHINIIRPGFHTS